jgi:hypothetical protein
LSFIRLIVRNKLAAALLVGFACFLLAPLWMNRAELPSGPSQHKCNKDVTDPEHDPRMIARPDETLKVIRLTNAGEFVDRCELTNALYELNWDRQRPTGSYGAKVKPGAARLPKLVLLYIHGWKHNADESDSDRVAFEKLIAKLRERAGGRSRVVGIYVGWNADSGMGDVFDNFSFWVKKNNADRIAQSSAMTLIVSSIGAIVHADPTQTDQFIAIGHSFGARTLFSATEQSLISATEQAHPGYAFGEYKTVLSLADVVILLNPAFEASRYSAINDFARYDEKFSDNQPPLILTVSSEGDWATRIVFPVGQWIGLARSNRELQTLGNYSPFRTHRLAKAVESQCRASEGGGFAERLFLGGLCLQREPERRDEGEDGEPTNMLPVQRFNPFIVAQTTSDIIADHNDIWNPVFENWLFEMIGALQAAAQRAHSSSQH